MQGLCRVTRIESGYAVSASAPNPRLRSGETAPNRAAAGGEMGHIVSRSKAKLVMYYDVAFFRHGS